MARASSYFAGSATAGPSDSAHPGNWEKGAMRARLARLPCGVDARGAASLGLDAADPDAFREAVYRLGIERFARPRPGSTAGHPDELVPVPERHCANVRPDDRDGRVPAEGSERGEPPSASTRGGEARTDLGIEPRSDRERIRETDAARSPIRLLKGVQAQL